MRRTAPWLFPMSSWALDVPMRSNDPIGSDRSHSLSFAILRGRWNSGGGSELRVVEANTKTYKYANGWLRITTRRNRAYLARSKIRQWDYPGHELEVREHYVCTRQGPRLLLAAIADLNASLNRISLMSRRLRSFLVLV